MTLDSVYAEVSGVQERSARPTLVKTAHLYSPIKENLSSEREKGEQLGTYIDGIPTTT